MNAVRHGNYSLDIPEMKNVTPALKNLIKKILVPEDPRLTIDQIFDHPWIKAEI